MGLADPQVFRKKGGSIEPLEPWLNPPLQSFYLSSTGQDLKLLVSYMNVLNVATSQAARNVKLTH